MNHWQESVQMQPPNFQYFQCLNYYLYYYYKDCCLSHFKYSKIDMNNKKQALVGFVPRSV